MPMAKRKTAQPKHDCFSRSVVAQLSYQAVAAAGSGDVDNDRRPVPGRGAPRRDVAVVPLTVVVVRVLAEEMVYSHLCALQNTRCGDWEGIMRGEHRRPWSHACLRSSASRRAQLRECRQAGLPVVPCLTIYPLCAAICPLTLYPTLILPCHTLRASASPSAPQPEENPANKRWSTNRRRTSSLRVHACRQRATIPRVLDRPHSAVFLGVMTKSTGFRGAAEGMTSCARVE